MTTQAYADHSNHNRNLSRARIAGYVLLAGLLLEIVVSLIWFKGMESMASLIAVAVVASGVAGEIFFESKARRSDKATSPNAEAEELRGERYSVQSPIDRLNHTNSLLQFSNRDRRKIPSRRARGRAAA